VVGVLELRPLSPIGSENEGIDEAQMMQCIVY
jgi:hypothetical protein